MFEDRCALPEYSRSDPARSYATRAPLRRRPGAEVDMQLKRLDGSSSAGWCCQETCEKFRLHAFRNEHCSLCAWRIA